MKAHTTPLQVDDQEDQGNFAYGLAYLTTYMKQSKCALPDEMPMEK